MDAPAQLKASLGSRYQIDREIGRGGMATVYLARDVRHSRNVAMKVLNPELGAVLGAERFLSEIQVTANLQHPHLLPLFDSGEADGLLFYVMPYIEGESLRARLRREKQLPIDEALRITTSIASALDYAHRHGVIHRDLKPENILLHDGQPLVADFGIALAVSVAGGERITQTGISLGTPHYMSPEQATGDRPIDQRSDVYSLGAVLYEMLSGDPPHTASTSQGIIAKVLTDTPRSVRTTRPNVAPHIDLALTRALEKLPADRFSSAHEFAEALAPRHGQTAGVVVPSDVRTPGSVVHGTRSRSIRRVATSPALWASAFVLTAGIAISMALEDREDPQPVHFTLDLPAGERVAAGAGSGSILAISPDGTRIAFVLFGAGNPRRLFVRAVDEVLPRPILGSEGASQIAFSPDGRWIAFIADQQLKRVRSDGGPVTSLGEVGQTFGANWGPDDRIVVSTGKQLAYISATAGGALKPFTAPETSSVATLRWPHVLPGGKVLFTRWTGGLSSAKLAVIDTESGKIHMLGVDGTAAIGVVDDYLLYTSATSALFAVPFDRRSAKVTGSPVLVVDRVSVSGIGAGLIDVSDDGSLVYQSGSSLSRLVIVNEAGAANPLMAEARGFTQPRYSPDGRSIAVAITAQSSTDIHIYSIASGTVSRLTTEGSVNDRPEWTPDGKRVLFRAERDQDLAVWWQPIDFGSPAEKLISTPNKNVWEAVVAPDGNTVVYRTGTIGSADIWRKQLSGTDTARKSIATSGFTEWCPRVSPDGRWVAYGADDTRRMEVYVKALVGQGTRTQVSVEGGSCPVWSRDGRRLFYVAGQQMMQADVRTTPTFSVSSRRGLFEIEFSDLPGHPNWDVTPDGRNFLLVSPSVSGERVTVVYNWRTEMRRRLSTTR